MRKHTSHIITLAVGISIGVLGGILFAPAGGSNVRRSLSFQVKKLGEKLQGLITTLVRFKHKKASVSLAKVAGQDLVDQTVQKAQRLLEEVKILSTQLENNQELD